MQLDRSTKTFIAIFTLVACFILAVNHAVNGDPLEDWALAAVLLVISIVFWVWLWQEGTAETTAITTSEAAAPIQEWVINEEFVSALENATPAKPVTREPEAPTVRVDGSPEEEPDNATNEVVEAMPDEAPVVEEAKQGEPVAESKVGEAMAASKDVPEVEEELPRKPEPEVTDHESTVEDVIPAETVPADEPRIPVAEEVPAAPIPEEDQDVIETVEVQAADDLTRVEGIGPKYSATLISAGISTFEQVSKMTEAELTTIIRDAGMRRPPSVGTWAEQAALAAKGDWDGLAALQDRLTAGRRD